MKILFLDSPSFCKQDLISAFEKRGFDIQLFYHDNVHDYHNKDFNNYFDEFVRSSDYTFVFSLNYYPAISEGCSRNHLKYLSFVYDSPLVALYSYTVINPCNYIFLFDKACYLDFAKEGISTVYYLPLCANTARLSAMHLSADKRSIVSSDVSFVGSLYNEKHNLLDRMTTLDSYTKGYIDGIMKAQLKINGYFFIEELLTPDIIDAMQKALAYHTQPGGTESDAYVYANYFIARKLTSIERHDILKTVSEHYDTKLYTHNATPELPYAKNMGAIDYDYTMPHVFKNSRINLNITLRSIRSGMPLRAWDILGAGGFLLSNYQEDFLDFFVSGEDFDYFDGTDDLCNKIEYYLSHEKERKAIAENAFHKVAEQHTYLHRINAMLEIAGF